MNIEQVKQLKNQLRSKYEADEAAIDRVLELLQSTATNGHSNTVQVPDSSTIEKRVLDVIALLPNQFTLSDVMEKIGSDTNRASVSSVIFRLKESSKLTLIRPGQGRRAAIYGKP